MSAEILRRAAEGIRADVADLPEQPTLVARVKQIWLRSRCYMVQDPAVALAVADWLEATAAENDSPDGSELAFLNFVGADALGAVNVARAYLGSSDD